MSKLVKIVQRISKIEHPLSSIKVSEGDSILKTIESEDDNLGNPKYRMIYFNGEVHNNKVVNGEMIYERQSNDLKLYVCVKKKRNKPHDVRFVFEIKYYYDVIYQIRNHTKMSLI